MPKLWKKGRGKLGFLQPLLGAWVAHAESPMGPLRCTRSFDEVLGGAYIRLQARWGFANPESKKLLPESYKNRGPYEETALIGVGDKGEVCFWSFTSDGKHSQGKVADVTDLHPEAIGFEAQMPAGLARMAYWPNCEGGFIWVVEAKNAKGWRRFTEHHYRRDSDKN
ncbi:MAG TPA: hypothetical protein VKS79_19580 [Gemmataceae bacterium]|nr:hypothetical protein [Gemmataceae bacterium]